MVSSSNNWEQLDRKQGKHNDQPKNPKEVHTVIVTQHIVATTRVATSADALLGLANISTCSIDSLCQTVCETTVKDISVALLSE